MARTREGWLRKDCQESVWQRQLQQLEKQINKIRSDPHAYGSYKSHKFKGLKTARIRHHVLLFEVRGESAIDGEVLLWSVKHHNDPDYDP